MNFAIIGLGAIGTYIGASLIFGGDQVIFIERTDVLSERRERSLSLERLGQTYQIPDPEIVSSVGDALQIRAIDAVIVAIKSFDTPALAQQLAAYQDRLLAVISLQNGVENETVLAEALGKERIVAGTLTSAIGRRAAGNVVLERMRGLGLAAGHQLVPDLAAAFNRAELNARIYPHAASMKWSKLVTNLLANASSAILDMSPKEIFSDPQLFRLERAQVREALAVMKALDCQIVDLPGTPVRLLAFLMRDFPAGLGRLIAQRALSSGRGAKMPSFHVDISHGRRQVEVDYLNGAVVRYGQRNGIPTPVNQLLNETLLKIANGEYPRDEFARRPDKLLDRLRSS